MPYAPGITDISGQLLADGIRGAAATYAESQDKLRLTDREIAHLKGTVEFAAKKNILTPEQLAEFNTGNLAKKRELASLAGMAYQDLQDEEKRRLEVMRIQAGDFVPPPEVLAQLHANGFVQTSRGGFSAIPQRETEGDSSGYVTTPIDGTNYVREVFNGKWKGAYPAAGVGGAPLDPSTLPRVNVGGREGIAWPDGKGGYAIKFPSGAASGTVQKPMDVGTATTYGTFVQGLAAVEAEIAQHAAKMANDDNHYGFLNTLSREDKVAELMQTQAGLKAKILALKPADDMQAEDAAPKWAPGIVGIFKGISDEVDKAVKQSAKLTKAEIQTVKEGATGAARTILTTPEIQALAPVRTSAQDAGQKPPTAQEARTAAKIRATPPTARQTRFAAPALPMADPLQEPETGEVLPEPATLATKRVGAAELALMNKKIAEGADPAAIIKRLQERGYSTEGIVTK